jgi:hypothetical protein
MLLKFDILFQVNLVEFEIQAHALLPHLLFSVTYLGILFLARSKRDVLGFALIVVFCITLGLRDIGDMSRDADPVQYAFILSYAGDVSSLLGGVDFAIFSLLHSVTGALFNLATCFFFLHLLYIPALYLLYKRLREFHGVFFLLVGWMIFINSGLLLLANFFRQGICILFFLSILIGLCVPIKNNSLNKVGALGLPLLHLTSAAMIPGLFVCRKRYYYYVASLFFVLLCLIIHFAPNLGAFQSSGYFNDASVDYGTQQSMLWIKIFTIYIILAFGYFLSLKCKNTPAEVKSIQQGAIGLILPTAALLLTLNAPVIGLRYLYYSYALAFLYIATVVSFRKGDMLYKFGALAICLFGFVTWTYPTVAVLLIW